MSTANRLPKKENQPTNNQKFGTPRGFNFAARFNRAPKFKVDTSNFEYYDLEDLFSEDGYIWPVLGLYFNKKSQFQHHYSAATDSCYINLPSHLNEACESILNDPNGIRIINEGHLGFKIYQYSNRRGGPFYSVEWVDLYPSYFELVENDDSTTENEDIDEIQPE